MTMGSVAEKMISTLKNRKMHFTLIDPDKQTPEAAGKMALAAQNAGTDAIMVGGSGAISQELVDETAIQIKKQSSLPVILFPSGASFLSKHADAIFFMSLLNSKNPKYLIREQAMAAPIIQKLGIEPISMGYVVIEPGMTVGRVGEVDLVKRDDAKSASGYALAAQYFGMDFVYLEAGSGAKDPVPEEMILTVRRAIGVPLIVGGGIKDEKSALSALNAGADVIVTGTLVETSSDVSGALLPIINAVRSFQ